MGGRNSNVGILISTNGVLFFADDEAVLSVIKFDPKKGGGIVGDFLASDSFATAVWDKSSFVDFSVSFASIPCSFIM
eukprot:6129410-Ditylum_brightwellii.AAC.1